MISRQDVLLLLTDLQAQGYKVEDEINNLYSYPAVTIETLTKINDFKPLDLVNFYTKLRSSYNNKHSKLYINIMKSDEQALEDINKVLTTLSALLNQILQFEVNDKPMFMKAARATEITEVLKIYCDTYNIQPAFKLIKLIKADIIASEYINRKRV